MKQGAMSSFLLSSLAILTGSILTPSNMARASVLLSPECKSVVDYYVKNGGWRLLEVANEHDDPLRVSWNLIDLAGSRAGEQNAASDIGSHCPSVMYVIFSGSTSGSQHWYMRSTNFAVTHKRGSGYPGDFDKYSHWNEPPSNYDPYKNYFPSDN